MPQCTSLRSVCTTKDDRDMLVERTAAAYVAHREEAPTLKSLHCRHLSRRVAPRTGALYSGEPLGAGAVGQDDSNRWTGLARLEAPAKDAS